MKIPEINLFLIAPEIILTVFGLAVLDGEVPEDGLLRGRAQVDLLDQALGEGHVLLGPGQQDRAGRRGGDDPDPLAGQACQADLAPGAPAGRAFLIAGHLWKTEPALCTFAPGRRKLMKETPQQYTQRILGYLEGKRPMEIVAETPRQIAQLVKDVSKEKLSKRPATDKWSVTELLAHLADSELVFGFRIRLILGASGTPIQAFDQDAWAKFSDYANSDPALSLEALRITRERMVRLLKSLPPSSWDLYGMHSERGKETVTRVVEMMAGHDVNHVKQIREILAGK